MKLCTVFFLCCGFFSIEAKRCEGETYGRTVRKCIAEHKLTPEEVNAVMEWQTTSTDRDKCFRACVMTGCNEMDDAGNLVPNGFRPYTNIYTHSDASITESNINAIENCMKNSQVGGDRCATAAKYMDCIHTDCKDCNFEFLKIKPKTDQTAKL